MRLIYKNIQEIREYENNPMFNQQAVDKICN